MIAGILLVACAFAQTGDPSRVGADDLREATRLAGLDDAEAARVLVDRSIAAMLRDHAEATDDASDRELREAGALAYKLRSMESARRAWDAVRKYREKTLDPNSREVQNARGNVSWIGEQMGLLAEARGFEEQILAALEKNAAPDDEALLFARSNLGDTLLQQNVELERALELMRQVAEARRARLPAGNKKRLRAELDLACGLVGVGQHEEADAVAARVLFECPADATDVRVRAAADLLWIRAARGERDSFRAAVTMLADEIEHVHAQIEGLAWRAAEIRMAELAPFEDLLASAVRGVGVFPHDEELARRVVGPGARAGDGPAQQAAFHCFERSRIERAGENGLRVVADERLTVLLTGTTVGSTTPSWLDLGPMDVVRKLVQAWRDAAEKGPARDEARAVTEALFVPIARALGDPESLRVLPDDVIWAVPFAELDLETKSGRAIAVEVALAGDAARRPLPVGPLVVFGAPAPESPSARADAPDRGGAAGLLLGVPMSPMPPLSAVSEAWSARLGVEAVRGEAASWARFRALAATSSYIVLTQPLESAFADVPCLTTPRAITASTSIASAMAREDVVGGSSPADLCWIRFADGAGPASDDGRVRAVRRAADVRDAPFPSGGCLVVADGAGARDVRVRSRTVESFARAFAAAGFRDVTLAVRAARDVGTVASPAALDSAPGAPPAATISAPDSRAVAPWLRVRSPD